MGKNQKMSVTTARKVLSSLANNISDQDIEKDIKVAEMLKATFFKFYMQETNKNVYNKNNDKT